MKNKFNFLLIVCFCACVMPLRAMENVDSTVDAMRSPEETNSDMADTELLKLVTRKSMVVEDVEGKGKAKQMSMAEKVEEILQLGSSSSVVSCAVEIMQERKDALFKTGNTVSPDGFMGYLMEREGYSEERAKKTVDACYQELEMISMVCSLLESYQVVLPQQ